MTSIVQFSLCANVLVMLDASRNPHSVLSLTDRVRGDKLNSHPAKPPCAS